MKLHCFFHSTLHKADLNRDELQVFVWLEFDLDARGVARGSLDPVDLVDNLCYSWRGGREFVHKKESVG